MEFDDFMRRMLTAFPLAEVHPDNDGQLVVYTGLQQVVRCKFCQTPLHFGATGTVVDSTGGDCCWGDVEGENENEPHAIGTEEVEPIDTEIGEWEYPITKDAVRLNDGDYRCIVKALRMLNAVQGEEEAVNNIIKRIEGAI